MEHWNTTDGENEVERQRFRKDLDGLALEGARRMITAALEIEVEDFLDRHRSQRGEDGRAPVVRNGYGQLRQVTIDGLVISQNPPEYAICRHSGNGAG